MSTYLLINKEKIRADSYILGFMVSFYLIFLLIFQIEGIFSIIAYPLIALLAQGVLKIISSVNKRNRGRRNNINQFLMGMFYVIIAILLLGYFITFPNITSQRIINLIAFPIFIVGIAGILKCIIIKVYSLKSRIINTIIGGITIELSIMAFFSPFILPESFFLFHIINLSISLIFNILGRAALYLSEFGLKLISFRNFKIFFYIISDYLLQVDNNGNLILDKIEFED
ncbi:MAG: hypothetical protein JSV62_01670 [Promethearchaeota archaeon]|nr:MAG: hypothetical protein JSV62_01670 [Candidatus Lokiarchaeota archaeon]